MINMCGKLVGECTSLVDPISILLGGVFNDVFCFHTELWGRLSNLTHNFSNGLKPPTSIRIHGIGISTYTLVFQNPPVIPSQEVFGPGHELVYLPQENKLP